MNGNKPRKKVLLCSLLVLIYERCAEIEITASVFRFCRINMLVMQPAEGVLRVLAAWRRCVKWSFHKKMLGDAINAQ